MPTPDRAASCPALHVLHGVMGRDDHGRPLWPSHHDPGHDGHCAGLCHCHQPIDTKKERR